MAVSEQRPLTSVGPHTEVFTCAGGSCARELQTAFIQKLNELSQGGSTRVEVTPADGSNHSGPVCMLHELREGAASEGHPQSPNASCNVILETTYEIS